MAVQPAMFPEIDGPDFIRSDEVKAVGLEVLDMHGGIGGVPRLHPIAEAIRDGDLRIMWLFNEKPFNEETEDDQEPEIAGRCVKAPKLWHDITGVDFAIWVRKHFWDDFNTELRRAVVLHELLHIEIKRDKDNQPRFATRKHDVEDFVDVARQYGPAALAGDGARYVRASALFGGEQEPTPLRTVEDLSRAALDAVADAANRGELDDPTTGTTVRVTRPGQDTGLTCVGSNHVPGCEHVGPTPRRTASDA